MAKKKWRRVNQKNAFVPIDGGVVVVCDVVVVCGLAIPVIPYG